MAVVHGNWVAQGYLFLWGETWRRVMPTPIPDTVQPHPFAMTVLELTDWLQLHQQPQSSLPPWPPNCGFTNGNAPDQDSSSLGSARRPDSFGDRDCRMA
ncbi:hypothetical protein [Neosynechococcus sphagnicola]|uniref:hypothetical protein n=1 Tax=Neosynechococcus sphagnicola TaxID=1501145 RepID=UPI0019553E41|nr:hypothetical protein [Neosynechococcus sphagnicola]